MEKQPQLEVRYEPRHCAFFRKHVWAIVTKQADGAWNIVNCLDKDEPCFGMECVFTTSGGTWPYPNSSEAIPGASTER